MPLEVIPMIYFGILRIFGEKNAKDQKLKSGHFEPLRCRVGCLTATRLRCPKGHPSGMPWISFSTLQCSYCSRRTSFWILFRKSSIRTLIV